MENQQYSLANLPEITFAVNNQGNKDLRYNKPQKSIFFYKILFRILLKNYFENFSYFFFLVLGMRPNPIRKYSYMFDDLMGFVGMGLFWGVNV